MLKIYPSGLDLNMKNNILTAQYMKQKLTRMGYLTTQSIYNTIKEFFPQFNENAIGYMNTEITISLSGETIYQIRSILVELFNRLSSKLSGLVSLDEQNILISRPELFYTIQTVSPNIYIIRI
jgi:hypothetical protein